MTPGILNSGWTKRTVLLQECIRYNKLLAAIKRDLANLLKALKGLIKAFKGLSKALQGFNEALGALMRHF